MPDSLIMTFTHQNPKEKSKINAELKSTKSKKIYYPKWSQKKTYSGRSSNTERNFTTLQESKNLKRIKTKRINDELTQYTTTHNIKKNTQTY